MTEYYLSDITTKIGSGATPRGGSNVYLDEGIALIRSQNVGDGDFLVGGLARISDGHAEQLSNVIVQDDDVLLNITGDSVARSCRVPKSILPARVNQHVAIIRADVSKADAIYLSYVIGSKREFLLQQSEIGATRRALTKSMIEDLIISLPPLPEQRRIAGILSAFDAKIDLLRRQNGVLEAMAGAVFREWFVERRKGDWEEVCVSDLANHIKDSVKPGDFPNKEFAHYSLPAFDDGKRAVVELGGDIKSNKYAVPLSSILVSKLNPRFPRVWWIDADAPADAICSTEFQVVKPKDPAHAGFLLEFLKSRYATDALMMSASGTSGSHQRVRPQDIFDLGIEVPGEAEMVKFGVLTCAWLEKAAVNEREMRVLGVAKEGALKNLMG